MIVLDLEETVIVDVADELGMDEGVKSPRMLIVSPLKRDYELRMRQKKRKNTRVNIGCYPVVY